jgi:hypothetical protein
MDLLTLSGKDTLSYACAVTTVVVPNMKYKAFTKNNKVSSKSHREPVSLDDCKLIKSKNLKTSNFYFKKSLIIIFIQ